MGTQRGFFPHSGDANSPAGIHAASCSKNLGQICRGSLESSMRRGSGHRLQRGDRIAAEAVRHIIKEDPEGLLPRQSGTVRTVGGQCLEDVGDAEYPGSAGPSASAPSPQG